MKLLMITSKPPYPPREGMTLRTWHLVRRLALRHELFLVSLLQSAADAEGLGELRRHCAFVAGIPLEVTRSRLRFAASIAGSIASTLPYVCRKYDVPAARALLRELAARERFDAVHFDVLPLAVYRDEFPGIPSVLVEHNVESELLLRRATNERNPAARSFFRLQWRRLQMFERAACESVERCVAVSSLDCRKLRELAPRGAYTVVPNGTDTAYFTPAPAAEEAGRLVFVGSQAWYPNRDGLRQFLRSIFPLIRAAVPGVTLDLVGKATDRSLVPAALRPCVRVLGTVEDIRPYVQRAAVYIVPLRIGGGTRLKILDAMAMGKAIVSTAVGCEGIEAEDGRHLLVADDPKSFARRTVRLLRDPAARKQLGTQARRLAESAYDWDIVYAGVDGLYCRDKASVGKTVPAGDSGSRAAAPAP